MTGTSCTSYSTLNNQRSTDLENDDGHASPSQVSIRENCEAYIHTYMRGRSWLAADLMVSFLDRESPVRCGGVAKPCCYHYRTGGCGCMDDAMIPNTSRLFGFSAPPSRYIKVPPISNSLFDVAQCIGWSPIIRGLLLRPRGRARLLLV